MNDQDIYHEDELEEEESYWKPEDGFGESDQDDFEYPEYSECEELEIESNKRLETLASLLRRRASRDKSEGIAERQVSLEDQYEQAVQDMDTGKMSREVGEGELLRIRYKQIRLETQNEMANMGISYGDLGDVSDDYTSLLQDVAYPEGREIRRLFRSLQKDEQEEVLRRAVENGKISDQQAEWFSLYWG